MIPIQRYLDAYIAVPVNEIIWRIEMQKLAYKFTLEEAYAFMGLPYGASSEEVKNRYRLLSVKYHPDLGGDVEMMKKLNAAKEMIDGGIVNVSRRDSQQWTKTKVERYMRMQNLDLFDGNEGEEALSSAWRDNTCSLNEYHLFIEVSTSFISLKGGRWYQEFQVWRDSLYEKAELRFVTEEVIKRFVDIVYIDSGSSRHSNGRHLI